MPFNRNDDLPKPVRDALPSEAQTVFRNVVNSQLDRGLSEERAFASAWAAVKRGWEKGKDGAWVKISKAEPRTLYVRRDLKNADELVRWAKGQGFKTTLSADDMHVTVCYSKEPVDWFRAWQDGPEIKVPKGGPRQIAKFGEGAIVLLFASDQLQWRHQHFMDIGASFDFNEYQPHVTITYEPGDVDLEKVEPYQGELQFGPEVFEEIDEGWKDMLVEKRSNIFKVGTDEQRMAYGWASVISDGGKPVVDLQDHVIEGETLVKAAISFMQDARLAKVMHEGDGAGEVLFAYPVVKGYLPEGITSDREGLIIGIFVKNDEAWEGVKSGKLPAFSIAGSARKVAAIEKKKKPGDKDDDEGSQSTRRPSVGGKDFDEAEHPRGPGGKFIDKAPEDEAMEKWGKELQRYRDDPGGRGAWEGDSDVTDDQIAIVRSFTGSDFYKPINKALYTGNLDDKVIAYERALNSSLESLARNKPIDVDTLYRGYTFKGDINDHENMFKNAMNGDNLVTWKAFSSTTSSELFGRAYSSHKGAGVLVIIKNPKSAVGVQSISKHPIEEEYLMPTNVKFKVNSVERTENGLKVELEEFGMAFRKSSIEKEKRGEAKFSVEFLERMESAGPPVVSSARKR